MRMGRYELLERLGSGGMGEVFRARDRLGGIVALKRIAIAPRAPSITVSGSIEPGVLRETTEDATGSSIGTGPAAAPVAGSSDRAHARPEIGPRRAALAREFRVLASIRHPNVVQVRDYGFDEEGSPFYTMELLDDARPVTSAARGRSLEERVALAGELLRAVAYLHRRNILHGDLKPNNVLVVGNVLKVVDFGLAHLLSSSGPRSAAWGTRGYRAPELDAGVPPSTASDLFAVGAILAELFEDRGDALPELEPIVARLLDPDWRQREHRASAVLEALERATGMSLRRSDGREIEDALASCPLVGRDPELAALEAALADAARGAGGAWLLVGEAGVGKSRLVDELVVRALVAGALVLEGQATSDAAEPYAPFLAPLRRLLVQVEPTAAEHAALVATLPSLAQLIGAPRRPIEPSRERFVDAIASLLDRAGAPLLLIVEDLHWAGADTLDVTRWLAESAETHGWLLVATQRPDNVRFDLGSRARVLRLGRLRKADAVQVANVLLGAGEPVAERIADESEGNPLVLTELARSRLLYGVDEGARRGRASVETLMRARLDRVAPPTRRLIELAAIIGREVRFELLHALAPQEDLDAWASVGVGLGILEARTGGVRFSHALLQSAVLALVPTDDQKRLHARVGETLATLPDAAPAELAHHFLRAGEGARAARYASEAADRALAASAYAEVVAQLTTALEAGPRGPGERDVRARWHRLLAAAQTRIGNYEEAARACREAIASGGGDLPASPAVRALHVTRGMATLIGRTIHLREGHARSARLDELARAYIQLAEAAFYLDDPTLFLLALLRSHDLAARGAQGVAALTYSGAGLLLGTAGLHPLARTWFARARAIAEHAHHGSGAALATVIHREGAFLVTRASWDESRALLQRAEALSTDLGDRRQWQETTTVLGLHAAYRGDFAASIRLLEQVDESGRKHGDTQAMLWGALRVSALLRLGDDEAAAAALERATASRASKVSVHDQISIDGFESLLDLRRGERTRAAQKARRVISLVGAVQLRGYWTFQGLDAATETIAELLATEDDAPTRADRARDLTEAAALMEAFRRVCPFAGPTALAWTALAERHAGHRRRASETWSRARALRAELATAPFAPSVQRELDRLA